MEILDLKSPADWESRINFVPHIRVQPTDLDRIIGKYDLPRPPPGSHRDEGKVHCGLNGCNELHFRGFLLLLKTGQETIIGRDCGRRELGVVFEEIEATFQAEETRVARLRLLAELQNSKQELIAEATAILPGVSEANNKLATLRGDLSKFSSYWRHITNVARQDGRILVAGERSELDAPGGSVNVVTAATIRNSALLVEETYQHPKALQLQVLYWLQHELDGELAAAGDDVRRLGELTRKAAEMRNVIRDAKEFKQQADELLKPQNLAGLTVIFEKLLRRGERQNALERAIRRATQT